MAVGCLVGSASESLPDVATGGPHRTCLKVLGADMQDEDGVV